MLVIREITGANMLEILSSHAQLVEYIPLSMHPLVFILFIVLFLVPHREKRKTTASAVPWEVPNIPVICWATFISPVRGLN